MQKLYLMRADRESSECGQFNLDVWYHFLSVPKNFSSKSEWVHFNQCYTHLAYISDPVRWGNPVVGEQVGILQHMCSFPAEVPPEGVADAQSSPAQHLTA